MEKLWKDSHTSAGHSSYLEGLYESYLENPASISLEWKDFFDQLPDNNGSNKDISHKNIINAYKNHRRVLSNSSSENETNEKQVKVVQLIQAYRNRGHQAAKLDPLGMMERELVPDLTLEYHGLSKDDLKIVFKTDTLEIGKDKASLQEVIDALQSIYCGELGIEYNYIVNTEERKWFQGVLEPSLGQCEFEDNEKKHIFNRLNSAEGLAKFLAAKYPGMKRFGIDGCESLIPLVDALIQNCGMLGAKQICFGMAHRGRLNLLVNVLGKTPAELFSAFEEDLELTGANTGDVKYHLGFSSNLLTPNGEVHVSLFNNPSHLEIVDPVVLGSVRARQDRLYDENREQVIPILIHGDASFSGQGVVMESLQMSQTRGYGVGGTLHVIVNNQIGFTTSYKYDARSTEYSTDVAKMIEAPIIHVNGDNPEMVVHAAKIACEYRHKFGKDIILDLFCYRRRGHNEADDPSATQPLMYEKIAKHPSVLKIYEKKLISEDIITQLDSKNFQKVYRDSLEEGDSVVENLALKPNDDLWFDWSAYLNQTWWQETDTTFNKDKFIELSELITSAPDGFKLGRQVYKVFEDRKLMAAGKIPINWGFAESMAYATLLSEGYPIRLTGQDVRRGTFSHRHAAIYNAEDGLGHIPLVNVARESSTRMDIYDSFLSEEAVLAFEYGYSATWPSGLVMWEAQFGDFVNGAQVVIDQFIVSAEHKWERLSGLIMLLPHGFEGQGPEHSSARLERFLQLCADGNIEVCVPSTPAQIFHLLRRQAIRKMRRPLVVISPKSLLRNPAVTSTVEELTEGKFKCVIDDELNSKKDVTRVVMCSGKIYYDLLQKRNEDKIKDTALVRIEQLYSFPYDDLESILSSYPNLNKFIWCQEEPANQGAWFSHRHRLQRVLDRLEQKHEINLVSRPAAAAPAVGLMKLHLKQQEEIVLKALNIGPQGEKE
ncbi:2-oxoglutarate dehydrogenase E1 component [Gammaproteobacteria bacterium]|nr:2-oxoglutarate dehydrogenase E1 component [Gammaproteobacteria bacterium]